jgi:glucose-6-phosphate 1-epimerase
VSPLEPLQRQFEIPGLVKIEPGRGGLPVVRVTPGDATGEMHLHGGQVMSWAPTGARDVLFVSGQARYEDGRAIRGGIPVCAPWFGAHAARPALPAHGFVRTKAWSLDAVDRTDDGIVVTMSTRSDDETLRVWPHEFLLVNRVTFASTLQVELTMRNTGDAPLSFEEALHTYYRVGDVTRARVLGLEGTAYLDSLDGLQRRSQDDVIDFADEVDRIYLDTAHREIAIDDPVWDRRVRVTSTHSRTTVVWNPWTRKAKTLGDLGDEEWRDFVCVETCNVQPAAIELAPGQPHVMRLTIAIA